MDVPAVEVHNLKASYRKKPVLYGLDFAIPKGQLVGILGPNGAGKSTLLKSLMGLIPGCSGWVKLFGKSGSKSLKHVAYVPQRESVDWDFPVCVRDVVMMGRTAPLGLLRRPGMQDYHLVAQALERVGLTGLESRQIGELSGGQQQRVFIARALAQESDLLLLDEPFAGVDATTETLILNLLKALKSQGKTILMVHHDLLTARTYFDSILLINMRLIAQGPPEVVLTEAQLHKAYAGRLDILSQVADTLSRQP